MLPNSASSIGIFTGFAGLFASTFLTSFFTALAGVFGLVFFAGVFVNSMGMGLA